MVDRLTEHLLIAAMYTTTAAALLWEDRPSSTLAQAAHDAPSPGLTPEGIHHVLLMQAPPKAHPLVCPVQLVGWDAMNAPPATAQVQVLRHGDTWWTVESGDDSKARRATAHTPNDEVAPRPRAGDRLKLVARVPHTLEVA